VKEQEVISLASSLKVTRTRSQDARVQQVIALWWIMDCPAKTTSTDAFTVCLLLLYYHALC